jgi:tetratricopeptide (TPR) repeat protein
MLAAIFIWIGLDRSAVAVASPKEEWRTAGAILGANVRPGDTVITPGSTTVVYFYAPHAMAFQNNARSEREIAASAEHATRVWLVKNRYVFDPGEEIQAWLDGHGALPLRVDTDITLYYWRDGAGKAELLADAEAFQLPPSSHIYASLGEQFARSGNIETAATQFQRALLYAKSKQDSAHAHLAWGHAARGAGELVAAAEHYRAALALDADNVDAWVGLGRSYLDENQLTAAQDALLRALALEPNSYPALYFLAETYEGEGNNELAQSYYARAAGIIPELIAPP